MESLNTSVDAAPVSGGEGVAQAPASSSAGVETETQTPAVSPEPVAAQEVTANGGETVTPSPEEDFPDETAFRALPGEEQKSNWQRIRARVAELNAERRELSERAAIATQLEELGGLDALTADAQIARALFSHQQDENGNPIVDPQTGMPYLTAMPGLTQMQQQSSDAFYTMMWEGVDMQVDGSQSVGDWLLANKFGLNPALIDTYRQIQSPADAMRYAPQAVHPDELANVPEEWHEAYKSFDATDRETLQELAFSDEARFHARLQERAQNQEAQKFIQDAKQREQRDADARQRQWEQSIVQQTQNIIGQKREQTINAQMERLKSAFQPFGPDSPGNAMVYDSILTTAEKVVDRPEIAQKAESATNFYYQAERYRATGNALLASQAQAKADALTLDVQREYAKAATQAMEQWNTYLKGRIVAAQSQQTQTVAHAAPPPQAQGQPQQQQQPGKFGLGPDRIAHLASQLAMQKAGV